MTRKKQELKKPPLWIMIATFLSVMTGILTSVIGINNIQNYYHPYWFGLVFGGVGLMIGIWTALKIKPIIAVNQRLKNDYYLQIMYISIGFFGLFLMSGSFLNQSLSTIDKCDNFPVIDKYRQESRFRQPEINSLIVNINGESHRVICSYEYWSRTSVGQNINLGVHESKLGFDYLTVTNDKK
jgi:hypothetical protein